MFLSLSRQSSCSYSPCCKHGGLVTSRSMEKTYIKKKQAFFLKRGYNIASLSGLMQTTKTVCFIDNPAWLQKNNEGTKTVRIQH